MTAFGELFTTRQIGSNLGKSSRKNSRLSAGLAVYSVDPMALMCMVIVLSLLEVALRFLRLTQMMFRPDQPPR